MSLSLALGVVVLIGIFMTFGLLDAAHRRTVWRTYLAALLMVLGGCGASLAWLDAETSGSGAIAEVNPYLFAALALAGLMLAVANSVKVFVLRNKQIPQRQDPTRPPDDQR